MSNNYKLLNLNKFIKNSYISIKKFYIEYLLIPDIQLKNLTLHQNNKIVEKISFEWDVFIKLRTKLEVLILINDLK